MEMLGAPTQKLVATKKPTYISEVVCFRWGIAV
jgi:hypothetical protein